MDFIQFKNAIDNELNKENVVAVQQEFPVVNKENMAVKQEIPVVNEENMTEKSKKPIPYEQFVEYDRLTEEKLQKIQRENEKLKNEVKELNEVLEHNAIVHGDVNDELDEWQEQGEKNWETYLKMKRDIEMLKKENEDFRKKNELLQMGNYLLSSEVKLFKEYIEKERKGVDKLRKLVA